MAKARASGTPAKASRRASPAKSTAASPTRVTRSSPRRAVPSAKAQEAAATEDRVQSGRVTKKASPSKAATPAKKTSPTKASTRKASPAKAKMTTPAKKGKTSTTKSSPTKTPPLGMYSAEDREELLRVSPYHEQQVAMERLSKDSDYCAQEMASHMRTYSPEKTLDPPMVSSLDICSHYATLVKFKELLDGNARKTDDENVRNTRPLYRKLKKAMAALLGDGLNECLKQDVSAYGFATALAEGLRRNAGGAQDNPYFRFPRDLVPLIRVQEAKKSHDNFELTKRYDALARLSEKRGIPVPPMGPPASKSRNPSESPGKGRRESSVSSPVRTRSKSPAKAAARTRASSKSPAPIVNPKTRSKSPAKKASSSATVPAQDTTTTRQTRSRSKSPAVDNAAYTPADDDDDEPASPQRKKPAPKSPAKKRAAPTPVRSPSPPKKARSDSPAKTKTTGRTKPSPSPPAATPARSPSPAKRAKETSPVKPKGTTKSKPSPSPAPPTPNPQLNPRARSQSPVKTKRQPSSSTLRTHPPTTSPKRKSSTTTTTQPYKRPHPSHPARGKIISPTNPQTIPSLNNKPNPFHETLPAPEIWHRRMPPYFPFGETPYMEQELGREMAEDLKKGAEDKALRQQSRSDHPTNGAGSLIGRVASLASSAADAVRSTFTSPPKAAAPKKYPSMWDLPDVYGPDKAKRAERGGYRDAVDLARSNSDDKELDEDGDEYMTGGLH